MVGGVGVASCLLIGAFWDKSMIIAGTSRSGPLFVLIFLAGAVDSLTSVLFYPMVLSFGFSNLCSGRTLSFSACAALPQRG